MSEKITLAPSPANKLKEGNKLEKKRFKVQTIVRDNFIDSSSCLIFKQNQHQDARHLQRLEIGCKTA